MTSTESPVRMAVAIIVHDEAAGARRSAAAFGVSVKAEAWRAHSATSSIRNMLTLRELTRRRGKGWRGRELEAARWLWNGEFFPRVPPRQPRKFALSHIEGLLCCAGPRKNLARGPA